MVSNNRTTGTDSSAAFHGALTFASSTVPARSLQTPSYPTSLQDYNRTSSVFG